MVDIKYGSQKGTGDTNQDFILCKQLTDDCIIIVLADGMGGLQYGDIAATTVAKSIYDTLTNQQTGDTKEMLCKAFEEADLAIADKCRSLHCKMGAAVTALVIKGDSVYYAWQGNVRLYGKQNDCLLQLTEDHVKNGTGNTLLTRCVNGKGFRYPISVQETKVSEHSLLFLCTDGFYQSKDCMSLVNDGLLPSNIDGIEDDASYVLIKLQ